MELVLAASSFTNFTQALVKAIALGSIYAVLALGFVLIFKATQTVNFAHGAIGMAGALFLSILLVNEGLPLLPWGNPLHSVPGPDWVSWFVNFGLALILTAVLGLLIERLAIRPMIGEPLFAVAVITLGLEIMIRTFATDAVEVSTRPLGVPWGSSGFHLGNTAIAWSYVAAVVAALVAFAGTYLFFQTRTGVAMRAVAFDQEAAMAQGVSVGRVFAIAWAAGAALAAVGGIFASMSPWPPSGAVSAEGSFIAFRAFPAVILGGLDSVVGALAGGFIIGFAEIFAGEYGSHMTDTLGAGYQQVVPYVVMLLGLLVRPYGIFGTPEIRRV
ncbi:MAG: branched-chain amino acid ABC transporter permease [Actinomycetota bacterium]